VGKSAGRVILGAVLTVSGGLIGFFSGNWSLALSVASLGVGVMTQRSPVSVADRQGEVLENRGGAAESVPVIYGTTRVGGIFADMRVDANSTDRKRLVVVLAWCHGSRDGSGITSIDEVWFEERKAIDGTVIQAPFTKLIPGTQTKHLEFGNHTGSSTQTVDARLTDLFPPEWPSTSAGRGIAYSRLELWFNQDIYPSGLPTVLAKIRGNKVYDPRDVTWKHSNNPSLCIRDYLISPIYGLGIPEANLEDQSFIDMANYCDELVNIPGGGTQKRYTLDGWVDTSKTTEENLVQLCSSCKAQIVNEGDKWRIVIRRQRAVSGFKINAQNTVEGSWQYILPGSDSVVNVVRSQYVDPSRDYAADTVQWPEPGQANPYLTADNSFERRLEVQLPFTDNRLRAQQIGMITLRESREAIGVIVTLKEEGLGCRIGDLIEATYESPGWVDKPMDVAALMISPDGSVRAVLIEYEPTVYDLDTQFPQPVAHDTDLPNPFQSLGPTSLVLTSLGQELQQADGRYVSRIRVTYAKAANPFVDYYEIQARKSLTTDMAVVAAPFASSAFSSSGLTAFDATKIWNDNLSDTAWHTDSSVPGAYLRLDCGVGNEKEYIEARIYAAAGGHNAIWNVEYSDDGSTWFLAASGFAVTATGLNKIKWARVGAHRNWRIKLTNTPGAGAWNTELQFLEGTWDAYGRVAALEQPIFFVYPVTDESWDVRISAVNTIGVRSAWLEASHTPSTPDPRPQILTITLTNAHSDVGHTDSHTDVAHTDAGHGDAHTDTAHVDHTDHSDSHSDDGSHSDAPHDDSHGDVPTEIDHVDSHGDSAHGDHSDGHSDSHADSDHSDVAHDDSHSDGPLDTPHTDAHGDSAHGDHTDTAFSHSDSAHVDSHTDGSHGDSGHSDGHTDSAHSDGQFGVGVAIQADSDSASVKAIARKHGDHSDSGHTDVTEPTIAEVRTSSPVNGRNVVIVLLDVATGSQIQMNPGDSVRVGALAYSDPGGGGVEGPLALGSVSIFQASVAPVGTDKWWPT
jgi:hypothetical protein